MQNAVAQHNCPFHEMRPTLILLPGLAGNAAMWRDQLDALAAHRPVVTDVHLRHDTIADMAAALLDEHAGPLVLCGASMGGMLAMEAVRQAPQRIRGLALLGTSARPESDDMLAVRTAAIALFEQGRVAEVIEPNIAFAFHPDNAARLAADYLAFVLAAGAQQLIRQNRAVMARPDARVHLATVRCPVLVLCGDADAIAPPECAREIAGLVPGAQLELLARCGHMLTMEQPEAVNAALLRWLAGLPQ
jgi:pimeloyl-ACP methyl ester carboxylesterase